MSDRNGASRAAFPAGLILVEQSGIKQKIPQLSVIDGMRQAGDAMQRNGRHLREIKVVNRRRAVARWKADGPGWRRVA